MARKIYFPQPKVVSRIEQFRREGFSSVRRVNWRIIETCKAHTYVWWHYWHRQATPFAMLTKSGIFVIDDTSDYEVRRLIRNIAPFYVYRYGSATRVRVAGWLCETVSSRPYLFPAWEKYPQWLDAFTMESKRARPWTMTGDIICTEKQIQFVVAKPLVPKQVPIRPLKGCKLWGARSKSTPVIVKNPRSSVTWEQIMAEFPLFHKIALILKDDILKDIVTKHKWYSHLGWTQYSLNLLVAHLYEHLKINYPKITKVNIRQAIRKLPFRFSYPPIYLDPSEQTKVEMLYQNTEQALLAAHPELREGDE